MKKILTITTLGLLMTCVQTKTIYKDYKGGRLGFSNVRIILYLDSTYIFSERFDFPGVTRDVGIWRLSKTKLILSSNDRDKDEKLFNQDSFDIVDDKLLLFTNKNELEFNRIYRTLREVSE